MLYRLLVMIASALVAAHAHAGEAGKVIFAAGAVQVAGNAGIEGAAVQEGELLTTGKDGFLYIKTIDNGLFILRPNTSARIVAYHIDRRNPGNTRVKLELISGTARSKSGDAVKLARQNFRFNTPVAAIGVRGTDFTVYTDQETSRVAVLTGGVVVSGFAGACHPEGAGPCEGAASRELFAAQRGQLLQVKRGVSAPQLLQSSGNGADQLVSPRADEPVAKVNSPTAPILDARKSDTLDKLVSNTAPPQPAAPVILPGVTPPGVSPLPAAPVPQVPVAGVPATPPAVVPPAVTLPPVTPPLAEPVLPERALQWGRFVDLANSPASIPFSGPEGSERLIKGDYVIFRTAGRPYVTPERGSASFTLKGGEATLRFDGAGQDVLLGQVSNGLLQVDFGKGSFVTSFDVISGAETYRMLADGIVASNGRFGNGAYDRAMRPQSNNMDVDGVLSHTDGGSAAYLFRRRIDDLRLTIDGVTKWSQ
jgi:hypothetical protein